MNESRRFQVEYWTEMLQLKAHIEYLQLHHEASVNRQRNLNAGLAVLSSLGLALWVILGDAAEFWSALVIVLTAIFHALVPYMPDQRRVQDTAELRNELQELLLHAERQWYEVSEGQLNNRQISGLTITIRERKSRLERNIFGTVPLPRNEKFLAEAEMEAERYFNTHYHKNRLNVQEAQRE